MNKDITKLRLEHLGEIGFRLALFGLIFAFSLAIASFLSFFFFAIVAIIGFCLPIITLGIVLVFYPNYFSDFTKFLDNSSNVTNFFAQIVNYGKYVAIIGIIGAIIGAFFLMANKDDRHVGKFVFCIISAVFCLLLIILIVSGAFNIAT